MSGTGTVTPPPAAGAPALPAFAQRPIVRCGVEWLVYAGLFSMLAGWEAFLVFRKKSLDEGVAIGAVAVYLLIYNLWSWGGFRELAERTGFRDRKRPRSPLRKPTARWRMMTMLLLATGVVIAVRDGGIDAGKLDILPGAVALIGECWLAGWLLLRWRRSGSPRRRAPKLQSFENAAEISRLNPATFVLEPYKGADRSHSGLYSVNDKGQAFVLMRWSGALVFLSPSEWVELTEDSSVREGADSVNGGFTITRPGLPDFSFVYAPRPDSARRLAEAVPFPVAEHFSFPLFLANVLRSPERQFRMRHGWTDGERPEKLSRRARRLRDARRPVPVETGTVPQRFSPAVQARLQAAGWSPGRKVEIHKRADHPPLPPAAVAILEEFDGLWIDVVFGDMRTPPNSESRVWPRLSWVEPEVLDCGSSAAGSRLTPVACLDGDGTLCVDEAGRIYEMYEDLIYYAPDFDNALERALRGLHHAPLPLELEPGSWALPEQWVGDRKPGPPNLPLRG